MKLIDILIRELPKRGGWPDGVESIAQCHDGDVWYDDKCIVKLFAIAENARPLGDTRKRGVNDITREQYEAALAASKPEWNVEGLPPVGCECEVRCEDFEGEWVKIDVVYVHNGEIAAIVKSENEFLNDRLEKFSSGYNAAQFRPLRSEADKKRDASVSAMENYDQSCESIYDAIAAGKIPGVKLED